MGRNLAPNQETNTDRSLRARDNKRRHRARQKEYVSELERKVAMTREHEVRATKEVQSAAQRVMRENVRLRDLLRKTGYTDCTIDAWVAEDQCSKDNESPQLRVKSPSKTIAQDVAPTSTSQKIEYSGLSSIQMTERTRDPMQALDGAPCAIPAQDDSRREGLEVLPTQTSMITCEPSHQQLQRGDQPRAPCKLITMLAENPALDITQVSVPTQSKCQSGQINESEDSGSKGVECSVAYRMLMQHATSGEKMDRIAAALESGCTPSATGGCRVKESVIWRTLDQECS